MSNKNFKEKKRRMWLKTTDNSGTTTKKALSNFTFKPVIQVFGPKDGYIVEVKIFCDKNRYRAYIPPNPKRDEFIRFVNQDLQAQGCGGLVCSMSDHMFKTVLVDKINTFLESNAYKSRIGTSAIGLTDSRIAKKNVFVLSNKVQVDDEGKIMDEEDQEFVLIPGNGRSIGLDVKTPFSNDALKEALLIARDVLQHNFAACLFTIGCVGMGVNADLIRKMDGCPSTILVGKSGRGKTYSLKLAMAAVGMLNQCTKMTSKAALMTLGSTSSMGVYLDDPKTLDNLSDIFVDFYSGTSKSTYARGVEKVRSALFITSNEVSHSTARESRRIIYVPFSGESIRGETHAEIERHVQLKAKVHSGDLAASIGLLISLRGKFTTSGKTEVTEDLVPFVASHTKGTLTGVTLLYATALWFTREICLALSFSFDDYVKDYFINTVAPFALQHQNQELEKEQQGVDILQEFCKADSRQDEAKKVVSLGKTDGFASIIVNPSFFDGRHYSLKAITAELRKQNVGKTQCRNVDDNRVRMLLIKESFFKENDLEAIRQAAAKKSSAKVGKNLPTKAATDEEESSEEEEEERESQNEDDTEEENDEDHEGDDSESDNEEINEDHEGDDSENDNDENNEDQKPEDDKEDIKNGEDCRRRKRSIGQMDKKEKLSLRKRTPADSLLDALTPIDLPPKRPRKKKTVL